MSLFTILCIYPLQIFYYALFTLASDLGYGYGVGLLLMSLANALIFIPLNRFAATIEQDERTITEILKPQIEKIQKESHGSDRHHRIKALYARYAYHPFYAIRSALGVFLQLPFLYAAYTMLQSLPEIQGARLWGIQNLAAEDHLLFGVNLLPLLMTLINFAASYLTKGFTNREKIQSYIIAIFFAVILYKAPAALLIFWTANNAITLIKTIFDNSSLKKNLFKNKKRYISQQERAESILSNSVFVHSLCFFIVILGLFCPAALYLSDADFFPEGLNAILSRTLPYCLASAIPLLYLWTLCPNKLRTIIRYLSLALVIIAFVSCFIVPRHYGSLDVNTLSQDALLKQNNLWLYDLPALAICAVLLWWAGKKKKVQQISYFIILVNVSLVVFTLYALYQSSLMQEETLALKQGEQQVEEQITIQASVNEQGKVAELSVDIQSPITKPKTVYPRLVYPEALPSYNKELLTFSKTEPNVVVFLMDMFTGGHMEAMLEEDPLLGQALDGFTWYPDTVSVSALSIFSLPSVYGGPNYTIDKLNERKDETNISKWNEALSVLPKAFSDKGFEVTLGHVYNYKPDLFMPHITQQSKVHVIPEFGNEYVRALGWAPIHMTEKELQFLSHFILEVGLFRISPHTLRPFIYDDSQWNGLAEAAFSSTMREAQNETAFYAALPLASQAVEGPGTLKFYYSMLSHVPWHLEEEQLNIVPDPFPETEGLYISINTVIPEHYYTERQIMRMLLRFFAWLKAENIYDNTTVILVSDHDGADSQMLNKAFGAVPDNIPTYVGDARKYKGRVHALLLVKPANSRGDLIISDELMTNAEVAAFACEAIGNCPGIEMPYTGQDRLRYHLEGDWRFEAHPEKNFVIRKTHSVKGSMFKQDNWTLDTKENK